MRLLISLISLWLAGPSFAQGKTFAGTKSDVVRAAAESPSGLGLMPFFQMLIALGIVFALMKFLLPKMIAKLNKRLVPAPGSGIAVEESASFAGGSLYVVKARAKTLLLSASASGVCFLADLTETAKQAEPTFLEVLEAAQENSPSGERVRQVGLVGRVEPDPILSQVDEVGDVGEAEQNPEDLRLDDVHRILEYAKSPGSTLASEVALVEQEAFATRLPEDVKPLPPISAEPRPWEPRRLTREDREEEIDEILRRLQQLSP